MDTLLTEANITTLVAILGAIVTFVFERWHKASAEKADKFERRFQQGVEIAYSVVNEFSHFTKTDADEKVALGLKTLRDYLATHGQVVTPVEEERARLLFKALHGEEKK